MFNSAEQALLKEIIRNRFVSESFQQKRSEGALMVQNEIDDLL